MILEGTILAGSEFEVVEGRVVIEDGRIDAIEEATIHTDDIIVPGFVNAHTHIGDSIVKEAGAGLSLTELVAPPDGLKHRMLREADRSTLVAGMRRSARFMAASGTVAFVDFREGGVEGVELLSDAVDDLDIVAVALGRDSIAAMEQSDGYGAPSARDGEFGQARAATREAGKLFGIHAGERDTGDIPGAFALEPDFLVHMVYAEQSHLDRLAAEAIPVVVCPRSNVTTGVGIPPVREFLDRTTVALGTDNVMLNSPSMFREMEFTEKLTDATARDVLRMATVNGAGVVGLDCGEIAADRSAKLLVLDGDSDNLSGFQDPVRAVVRRAGVSDVKSVVF